MTTTWAQYDGWIVATTERAFGVAKTRGTSPEIWIPRSQCQQVTYTDGGDSHEIHIDRRISAMKLSVWFAEKEGLV